MDYLLKTFNNPLRVDYIGFFDIGCKITVLFTVFIVE
jgi:hypothetical protein